MTTLREKIEGLTRLALYTDESCIGKRHNGDYLRRSEVLALVDEHEHGQSVGHFRGQNQPSDDGESRDISRDKVTDKGGDDPHEPEASSDCNDSRRRHVTPPPVGQSGGDGYLGFRVGPRPLHIDRDNRDDVPFCAAGCKMFSDGWDHHRDCDYVAWIREQARTL